ncbi:hypothetical protein J7S99_10615 [Providencia rettgeri]|uniref:hypothetical protein n=1 Tax=Providencia rettgeri TaxID=587 RepID=UPI001B35C858|nr:hypothetical protein [Providencia rettgeri]MBQ0398052.1 hypothetical protein [Providencia rettgeri]
MKERGIIFNSEMVRAILDGRKTQTRRIINPQPELTQKSGFKWKGGLFGAGSDDRETNRNFAHKNCPLGKVGDRLWVRETWMPDAPRDGTWSDVEFYGCKNSKLNMIPERFRNPEHCIHRASWDGAKLVGWTPSIHMPRWASRITLEITNVRVERLQAASDGDFKAEGYPLERELTGGSTDAFCWFRHLWDSVSKPDCNYESNPWVWVIEFK